MKSLDYGKGYQYAHNVEGRVADMECLPPSLAGRRYYHPTQEGREKLLAQRMDEVARIRARQAQAEVERSAGCPIHRAFVSCDGWEDYLLFTRRRSLYFASRSMAASTSPLVSSSGSTSGALPAFAG